MDRLHGETDVIDGSALAGALFALADEHRANSAACRSKTLARLKADLAAGRNAIGRRFKADADGLRAARAQARLIDQILQPLYDFAVERVYRPGGRTGAERLSIIAVGGYGRGEMAPYSDVDLLFLSPPKTSAWAEQVIEYLLYLLWDLGLTVGHAARSVSESIRRARKDLTICTSLVEARYVAGDRALYEDFRKRFARRVVAGTGRDFVRRKLAERDERHRRFGDSRYVVEPNVKEGKGGLRDLHTLFWIAKYLYQVERVAELVERGVLTADEMRRFTTAEAYLWRVRCSLHYLAGRAEETLTFDVQQEIGRRFRYTDRAGTRGVERFMKHYYLTAKSVGDLTRIFCAAIEDQQRRRPLLRMPGLGRQRRELAGFAVEGGRLDVARRDAFERDPVKMIRLFHLADERGLDIHPHALRLITNSLKQVDRKLRTNAEANRLFLEILTSANDPETALRRMNEAGVFGRFVRDFGRVVAQMQYDMYHVYTVDEHSIRAIGMLAQIEGGTLADELPLASELVREIHSRRVLYLGLLLHDIAKGRAGDHSEIGAAIARKLGPRLGLSAEEVETTSWLVERHLLMSHVAFKRDLQDPKTVADFVEIVQSPERLRLLFVLTVADIRAVGPGRWNEWKGKLLSELYALADEALTGGHDVRGRTERALAAQEEVRARLADWSDAAFAEHGARMGESYWLSADVETLTRQARLVRKVQSEDAAPAVETRIDRFRGVSETTVYTVDQPGLFTRVAGAMTLSGAHVVDAKIFTTADGMALDTFWIQDAAGAPLGEPDQLARLRASIERALAGEINLKGALAKRPGAAGRTRVFTVEPRALIDNRASDSHTVIEINGRDRPGLLYDVTLALADLGISIASAHVATFGERAVDVFYVRDKTGRKITHPRRAEAVRRHLLAAIADKAVKPSRGRAKRKCARTGMVKRPGKVAAFSRPKSKSPRRSAGRTRAEAGAG